MRGGISSGRGLLLWSGTADFAGRERWRAIGCDPWVGQILNEVFGRVVGSHNMF